MEGTFEWERSDNRKVDEMIFGESDMRRLRLYMLMTLMLLLTHVTGRWVSPSITPRWMTIIIVSITVWIR